MDVASKGVYYCLLMLLLIACVIATGVAVALLGAKQLLLKALAVKLQASRTFTIATQFFFCDEFIVGFFFVYLRDYYIMRAFGVAPLREGGGGVSNGVRYRKAFLQLFNEGPAEGLGTYRVLVLQPIPLLFRVLPRTVVVYRRREKPIVGAR